MRPSDVANSYAALLETAERHWQSTAETGAMRAADGVAIHFSRLGIDNPRALVLIATGRSENYLKYKELAWQLNAAGYAVLLYDHRGQGLSDRLLSDPRKGHVHAFDDYVDDLKQLFDTLVSLQVPVKKILLAHSMGAAVAALYAIKYPEDFDALVMCSPMLGLPSGMLGKYLAIAIDSVESMLYRCWGREPGYIPCAADRLADISFEQNRLTHSHLRFEHADQLQRENPAIALGAPTARWVRESHRAFTRIFADLSALRSPLLLLQAGADSVVSNHMQNAFCARLSPHCGAATPAVIEGAWHELLHEVDAFRQPALDRILEFINRISVSNTA